MATNRRQNGAIAERGAADAADRGRGAAEANGWLGLDSTNRRLLAELQGDARLSLAELGRRVGLSSPAVADRLGRLERDGVIEGYHARVNARSLGYSLGVVIRIRPAPRQLPKVAALARSTPEIVECHRITGEDCYIMKAFVRDVEHLEELIDSFALYGQTTTSIIQSSPVPGRGVWLDTERLVG